MNKIFSFFFSVLLLSGFVFASPAFASDLKPNIEDSGFSAQYVRQSISDPITIEAGKTKRVDITFKNTGTATWNANSARYVSAFTMVPRYRVSPFLKGIQTARIPGTVAPGETGVLSIDLTAPKEPGEYIERFYLAAFNHSWMDNGYFFLKINVVEATQKVVSPEVLEKEPATQSSVSEEPTGKKIGQTKKTVSAVGGEKIPLFLIFQNISEKDWASTTLKARIIGQENGIELADFSWKNGTTIKTNTTEVAARQVTRERFSFAMPTKKGEYIAEFYLEGKPGAAAQVALTVTADAPSNYIPAFKHDSVVLKPQAPKLTEEPRIRVGLTGEGDITQFISYEDNYVMLVDGKKVGVLPMKKIAKITYVHGVYQLRAGDVSIDTRGIVRFEPERNKSAMFTVMKGLKDRSIAWVGKSEFLRYRGAFEYRRGETDGKPYIVNDLLLEDYVAGISETGHNVHIEAVKANLVAARSYAYLSKNKYPFFDVLGSTYDQLYLGADVANFLGNVPLAAAATRGKMVGYNDEVVTTPYFGNSNGTTKSWSAVWGGANRPWLVSVQAKYDAGRRQFGHGVGMSQRDAANRAEKDGWTYDKLLGHYYTGTELLLMYK